LLVKTYEYYPLQFCLFRYISGSFSIIFIKHYQRFLFLQMS